MTRARARAPGASRSGRVGVPPAVLRVPRSTRRTSLDVAAHNDVRLCSARCGTRRAGRPPYPRIAVLLVAVCLLAGVAGAHNADTSYARVRVFDDRIELRLTCDIFTLWRIFPDIDANQDRALSREELRRATPAVQQFFAGHAGLEINSSAVKLSGARDPFWPLDTPDPIPATLWHTNEALISFPFDIPLAAPAKDILLAFDVFAVFGDRHTVLGVFEYRGNSTEVVFSVLEPDYLFDVAFATGSPPPTGENANPASGQATAPREPQRSGRGTSPMWRFFKLGIGHILTGYDHLCFLLALLVVSRFRALLAIVTSFTIAHSITLLLAAFGIVTLSSRLIECAIALTIFYVAIENLARSDYSGRWKLTFLFGLIHGFGFANTLNPQELPLDSKARCLLVFNLGVEVGQLAVVAVLLPVSMALAKWRFGSQARNAVSIVVALLGLAWFLDRMFVLGWMPF